MLKRLFDVIASLTAICILSPLLVPLMIALRLTGEGWVFYRQPRVGRGGRPFDILKFATMLKDSPNMPGGDITVGRDPRILPMGHFLRQTKLNELPQLFNILKGDMSIIGPRPLTSRVAAMFPAEYWSEIANLRPGLSGVGSVIFRNEEQLLAGSDNREQTYRDVIAPYKAQLELWYLRNQTFWLDLKLIFLTLLAVVRPAVEISDWLADLPRAPLAPITPSVAPR